MTLSRTRTLRTFAMPCVELCLGGCMVLSVAQTNSSTSAHKQELSQITLRPHPVWTPPLLKEREKVVHVWGSQALWG